jgi:hypothetical protein
MATQLDDALNNIWQMRGVTGIALYSDGQPLFRHLPPEVDADNSQLFHRHLVQMINSLVSEGRKPRELYFGFSNGGLLIVSHLGAILAVVLRDEEVLGYLSKLAGGFLRDNYDAIQGVNFVPRVQAAAPEPAAATANLDTWHRYLDGLARILSKVIGTTQANYVVARVLSEEGLSQTKGLPRDRYAEFGTHVMHQVPNKAKQRALVDEAKLLAQNL